MLAVSNLLLAKLFFLQNHHPIVRGVATLTNRYVGNLLYLLLLQQEHYGDYGGTHPKLNFLCALNWIQYVLYIAINSTGYVLFVCG